LDETRKKLESAAKRTDELSKKMDAWKLQIEQQGNSPANIKLILEMARGLLGLNKAFIALTKRMDALESRIYGISKFKEDDPEIDTPQKSTPDKSVNMFV
jgi:uncharacterized protein YigA (DUF484 family)